eukprot:NODE_9097_length_1447_cov_3.228030.p1 GENE.NODE_9097_length_1447_cov_3.228030~~NODE_9097_length_1447_cov_3.228030.p1  ORF type:complete len:355 (+),score=94.99 NODE_9097_length_1447_cov_3.228030:224-1288(+)
MGRGGPERSGSSSFAAADVGAVASADGAAASGSSSPPVRGEGTADAAQASATHAVRPPACCLDAEALAVELRTPTVCSLESLNERRLDLERQHEAESLRVRQKYEAHHDELMKRRSEILLRRPGGGTGVGASAAAEKAASDSATPGLPGFWRTVLQNSIQFQENIERHDEPVLAYLRDIKADWLDEEQRDTGFRIRFHFNPNPYFRNTELDKVYHTERKRRYVGRVECKKVVATKILWNTGKNVTVDVISRKPKSGGRGRGAKAKKEEVLRPSFFRACFRNLGPDDEIPDDDLVESHDEEDHMGYLIEDDYEKGLALRCHLIPHAIRWYTGEACECEDDGSSSDSKSGGEEAGG